MSVTLGIDTSSTDLGIGIFRDAAATASYSRYIGNSHAEHIAPVIRMMLTGSGIAPEEVDRISVAVGPGSFTGLRIGIAFVKGFCIAHPVPVLPVSSLFILAHAVRHHQGRVVAAIDARNNDVFWAIFSPGNGLIRRRTDDSVTPSGNFTAALKPGDVVVTDTVGYRKSSVFSALPQFCTEIRVENHPLQRGLLCAEYGVASVSDQALWRNHPDIHPNYLRHSAPEERMAAKGKV